jgi:predicted phage tail protein
MGKITFAGGGGQTSKTQNSPDTLSSKDTVEVLLGIALGPIKGLVNGPKTFYADTTPLVNENGSANFSNFQLDFWPGSESGEAVTLALGGLSNPITVNQALAKNTAVTRSGTTIGHNAVDFRMVVSQLLTQSEKGSATAPLRLKFEYKLQSSPTWLPAWTADPGTDFSGDLPSSGSYIKWDNHKSVLANALDEQLALNAGSYSFDQDRTTLVTSGVPTTVVTDPRAVAWDSVGHQLYLWVSNAWAPTAIAAGIWIDQEAKSRRFFPTDVTPTDPAPGDLWLKDESTLLIFNGAAWVFGFAAGSADNTGVTLVDGVWSIDAKVSSNTPKDIRCILPAAAGTYEYRVTKLSDDSTTTNFSVVSWESIQEITRGTHTFHGVALARVLGQASDQLTSLPNWVGDYDLKIVKVASNYDAETRTYTGVWDGTYKLAFTNNLAWCLLDFIENDSYGMSSRYQQFPNKWKFYEFAQHCDTPVLRPDGVTYRPRWTFNDLVTTPRDAREMAQYIAGAGGALYIDDGNGNVDLVIDKDGPSIAIFTPENVGEDGFNYTYTDRLNRANQTIVEFINPNLNWNSDKRIVNNLDDQATYGIISENFIAVGCTDEDEAISRARRRQIAGLTEKEMVTFTTNRKGRYLSEWDIILVADPILGRGLSGRIRSRVTARQVSLRDPISLEAGVTYWATFDVVNPSYTPSGSEPPFNTVRRQITSAAGVHSTLDFGVDLPALAPHATFTLEAEGVIGFPKPFRIIHIDPTAGDGEFIQVTALELNRSKWAYADTGVYQEPVSYSVIGEAVLPPTGLNIVTEIRQKGSTAVHVLTLSWARPASKWVRSYKIYHSVNGTPVDSKETTDLSVEFEDIGGGLHSFSVVAVGMTGRQSVPASILFDMTGEGRPSSGAFALKLSGGVTTTTFDTPDATFVWTSADLSPTFSHYVVEIVDPITSLVKRTTNVGQALNWTYTFANMQADSASPLNVRRSFRVNVYAVDQYAARSIPATLTVSNPAPSAPVFSLQQGGLSFEAAFETPTDRDISGLMIWVSTTPGINPATTAPFRDTKVQGTVFLPHIVPETVYVRAAYYDPFSKIVSGLNVSAEQSVDVLSVADLFTDIDRVVNEVTAVTQQQTNEAIIGLLKLAGQAASADEEIRLAQHTVDGLPLGPVASEQKAITADNVETTGLIAIKKLDRSGVILRTDKIEMPAGGGTLAATFTNLAAQDASHTGSIATINTSLIVLANADTAESLARVALASVVGSNKASADSSLLTLANADIALASNISTLTATSNGHTASLATYGSALVSITGQLAVTYGVQLAAGNVVVGFQGVSNGITGGWVFDGDFFAVKTSSGTKKPFLVSGDTVYLSNTVIDGDLIVTGTVTAPSLATNAATSTARSSGSGTVGGTTFGQTVFSHYVYLPKAGVVDSDCSIAQHFPSGDHDWAFNLYIDGELQYRCYGANGQDSVSLSGSKECSAGYRLVEVTWAAHSSVQIDYRTLKTMGSW